MKNNNQIKEQKDKKKLITYSRVFELIKNDVEKNIVNKKTAP